MSIQDELKQLLAHFTSPKDRMILQARVLNLGEKPLTRILEEEFGLHLQTIRLSERKIRARLRSRKRLVSPAFQPLLMLSIRKLLMG